MPPLDSIVPGSLRHRALQVIRENPGVCNYDVCKALGIPSYRAGDLLSKLVKAGHIRYDGPRYERKYYPVEA